jgi:hypothetical protein
MATFGFVLSYPRALTEMWGLEPKLPVITDKSGLGSPIEESATLRQVERKEVDIHKDRVRGSFDDK